MSRHEYFRRLLCDWLGDQVHAGALPDEDHLLGPLVRAVSYENARRWLFAVGTMPDESLRLLKAW
jgi:glucuronate isomerase